MEHSLYTPKKFRIRGPIKLNKFLRMNNNIFDEVLRLVELLMQFYFHYYP